MGDGPRTTDRNSIYVCVMREETTERKKVTGDFTPHHWTMNLYRLLVLVS